MPTISATDIGDYRRRIRKLLPDDAAQDVFLNPRGYVKPRPVRLHVLTVNIRH